MNGILFDCCACCVAKHMVRHQDPCHKHQRAEIAEAKKAPKVTLETIRGGRR